jgi:hypothetical protein
MESFHDKIPFKSLPKTFQDAVIVTRKLGYHYLWIDALCILQDDLQEWQKEAPKMASIYHNSTCTIAAHTAKSDREGFLAVSFERISSIKLTSRPQFSSLYLGGSFKDQVNESFLTQRGWVFQERILSRRILHFTRHRVFFEDGSGVQTIDAGVSRTPLTHSPREDGKFMIEDIVATSMDWYKLVERYSICALTFDHDRLPAIAGIAAFVQTYDSADKYLFGIWSKSLQQGLLWLPAEDSPQQVCYGSTPTPPSWSWARWKGSIKFPLHISVLKPLFHLEDNLVHLERPQWAANSTEKLPFLSIQAEVMDLQNVEASIISRSAGNFSFDVPMHGLYGTNSKKLGIVNWMAFDGERQNVLYFPHLACVFISLYENTKWVYDDDREETIALRTLVWYFIILVKTDDGSECYRRVGIGAKYGHRPRSEHLAMRTIRIE